MKKVRHVRKHIQVRSNRKIICMFWNVMSLRLCYKITAADRVVWLFSGTHTYGMLFVGLSVCFHVLSTELDGFILTFIMNVMSQLRQNLLLVPTYLLWPLICRELILHKLTRDVRHRIKTRNNSNLKHVSVWSVFNAVQRKKHVLLF